MPAPLTPAQAARLQEAADWVADQLRAGETPADIIALAVKDRGASAEFGRDPFRFSFAGVAATCTWSRDHLIDAWRRNATRRLMADQGKGAGGTHHG